MSMPRDAQIPLFLWIATAVLVHLVGGGGATRAAAWIEEGIELRRFAEGVRSYVKSSGKPLEISLTDEPPPAPSSDPPADAEPDPEAEPEKDENTEAERDRLEPPPNEQREPELAEPEVVPPEKKKPVEEQKVAEEKKAETPAQELVLKKSIAVRQHVEDEKQPDNPDAELISEHNNRVREETQARITSNDQNDPKPTPGSSAGGVGDQPGNAHETHVAQSEDRAGEEGRAPSDDPAKSIPNPSDQAPNAGAPHAVARQHTAPAQEGATAGVQKPPEAAVGKAPSPGSKGQAEQSAQSAAPDLVAAAQGTTIAPLPQVAASEQRGQRARRKRELPRRKIRGYEDLLGLGASGTTASGINLNLTPGLAQDAIGMDQLSRERRADGARRRSQHLGSWKTAGIERWRSAIENYVPSVKPGNQTALNTARSPFGTYLSIIHNRLHPIFADWFLASLDSLPAGHPMNRAELSTNLEIVLDQDEGRVIKSGITKPSGVTMFDVAALESVQRASPFGPPPREILSPDGRVYLHWEFHRDPRIACTTFNARPYILKVDPKPAPTPPPPRKQPDDGPPERHGATPGRAGTRLARNP